MVGTFGGKTSIFWVWPKLDVKYGKDTEGHGQDYHGFMGQKFLVNNFVLLTVELFINQVTHSGIQKERGRGWYYFLWGVARKPFISPNPYRFPIPNPPSYSQFNYISCLEYAFPGVWTFGWGRDIKQRAIQVELCLKNPCKQGLLLMNQPPNLFGQ